MNPGNVNYGTAPIPAPYTPAIAPEHPGMNVMGRYVDGYRVARSIVGIGTFIKVIGAVFGLLTAGLLISAWQQAIGYGYGGRGGDLSTVLAIVIGTVVWLFWFVLGVIVSAQGQIMKATLDSAVHSSPFIAHEQRAQIMSLL
jgi:hypothetical protein